MRVKAFSLMELIVVVLLLGTIFSLALTVFNTKKSILKDSGIDNLPLFIKKIGLKNDATLYIYGDKCKKTILLAHGKIYDNQRVFTFKKDYKIYNKDNAGNLKSSIFKPVIIDKKERHICFKIDFNKGKFVDKLIVDANGRYLLFSPIYQEIKSFDTLIAAQKAYLQDDILPRSEDDYHH